MHDPERRGRLTWRGCEIRNFVNAVFHEQNLHPPAEGQVFRLYAAFNKDGTNRLCACECLCLVDALLRAIFGGGRTRPSNTSEGEDEDPGEVECPSSDITSSTRLGGSPKTAGKYETNVGVTIGSSDTAIEHSRPHSVSEDSALSSPRGRRRNRAARRGIDNGGSTSPARKAEIAAAGRDARRERVVATAAAAAAASAAVASAVAVNDTVHVSTNDQSHTGTSSRRLLAAFDREQTPQRLRTRTDPLADRQGSDEEGFIDSASEAPVLSEAVPATEATTTYLGKVQLDAAQVRTLLAPVAAANANHRTKMLCAMQRGEVMRSVLQAYQEHDRDQKGSLSWDRGDIWDFVAAVFWREGLHPPSQGQVRQIYAMFDSDQDTCLSRHECLCLVEAILSGTFASAAPGLDSRSEGVVDDKPLVLVPAGMSQAGCADHMTYLGGVMVEFAKYVTVLRDVALANASHHKGMSCAVQNGELARVALHAFQVLDVEGNGCLSWNDGGVQSFVSTVFCKQGLQPPRDGEVIFPLCAAFSGIDDQFPNSDMRLGVRECICLMDAIFRALLLAQSTLQDSSPGNR